ncbi:oligosaccharide flippase family protein [Glaciecola sp. SC05]|uniref:oligosaccharide flippase family protein n=1 Tax=Glaciecola sp. SC05 TaxID=1987355 RepID=UPI003526C537
MTSNTLKQNIIASYASQIYVVLVGILVLPFYISIMGAEAYGLIGFFAMLQAMFAILDLGLTPTISRETARYNAGAHSANVYKQLYRTLTAIFLTVAFLGGGCLFFLSNFIADKWLNIQELSTYEVVYSLRIMAMSIALRWMTGLYRGVVTGSEQLVWLSCFNVLIATLRFLLIFPVLWVWGATPMVFFSYQLLIALLEFSGLYMKANKLLPNLSPIQKMEMTWSLKPIKPYLSFALSIALTSSIWVLVTQTDKFIMSYILSLENYGYFTLAVLVAGGIMMIASPISGAIMPRMANLEAQGKREKLIQIYRNSTQLITTLAGTISILLVVFAEHILFVWTGDKVIVNAAAPTLKFYAAGYGLIAVGAFPYYLQYALGSLKLHVIGSLLFVLLLFPALWFATNIYGMVGAGYAWFGVNLIYFVFWTGVVHSKLIPGLHLKWFFVDFLKLLLLPICVALVCSFLFVVSGKLIILFQLIIFGALVLVSSVVSSCYLRRILILKVKRL